MDFWHRVHRWPRRYRWPLKVGLFAAVVAVVVFPKVWLVPTYVARLRDMNRAVDPTEPALSPLEHDVRAVAPPDATAAALLPLVERTVYAHVPYAFDWDTWGVMDYLPTTREVLTMGRADCSGRAVVAAALLRRMGHEAWLAMDLKHVWVVTPAGETMAPGAGEKTLQAGPHGTIVRVSPGTLANLGRALRYGVAVFPLTREIVILLALCLLTMHPYASAWRRVLGCTLVFLALGLVRDAEGTNPYAQARPWLAWWGLAALVAGWLLLAIRGADRRSRAAPPG